MEIWEKIGFVYLVPQCDRDGAFSKLQCWNGKCWCVNEDGSTVRGTESNSRQNCLDGQWQVSCTIYNFFIFRMLTRSLFPYFIFASYFVLICCLAVFRSRKGQGSKPQQNQELESRTRFGNIMPLRKLLRAVSAQAVSTQGR